MTSLSGNRKQGDKGDKYRPPTTDPVPRSSATPIPLFPSGKTDPKVPEDNYVYVVFEVSNYPNPTPSITTCLCGIFTNRENAIDAAHMRVHQESEETNWSTSPARIDVPGKEYYLAGVKNDGSLLAVYVEQRPLQREPMIGKSIDEMSPRGSPMKGVECAEFK